MAKDRLLTSEEKEIFGFLNRLRESGATNMFGAGAYIVEEFEIGRNEARDHLKLWMSSFTSDADLETLKVPC